MYKFSGILKYQDAIHNKKSSSSLIAIIQILCISTILSFLVSKNIITILGLMTIFSLIFSSLYFYISRVFNISSYNKFNKPLSGIVCDEHLLILEVDSELKLKWPFFNKILLKDNIIHLYRQNILVFSIAEYFFSNKEDFIKCIQLIQSKIKVTENPARDASHP